jgi:hypothetical protein
MKPLKKYIYNGLFSKSGIDFDEIANTVNTLPDLKKYSYDNLNWFWQTNSPWDNGSVELTDKGIVIKFPKNKLNPTDEEVPTLVISEIKSKQQHFNICEVIGQGVIYIANNEIETIEGIFTPGCKFSGECTLTITSNPNLKSLKGCPDSVGYFICTKNKKLNSWEGAPKNCYYQFRYEDDYNGIPYLGFQGKSNTKITDVPDADGNRRIKEFIKYKKRINNWMI